MSEKKVFIPVEMKKSKEEIQREIDQAELKMDEMIKQTREAGIDVDTIGSVISHEFREYTERYTKDFFKIAKKKKEGEDKQIVKFVQEKIFPAWKKFVLPTDPSMGDIMEMLDKKTLAYYIGGIFIIIHSKDVPNPSKKVKASVSEMAAMAVKSAIDKGLIKPGQALPE